MGNIIRASQKWGSFFIDDVYVHVSGCACGDGDDVHDHNHISFDYW